jgi:hypothetical protein
MNAFEAALLARGVANMTGLLDVAAASDYFLATEVTKNPDGYRGSVKMYKDRGQPLVIGPLWVSAGGGGGGLALHDRQRACCKQKQLLALDAVAVWHCSAGPH